MAYYRSYYRKSQPRSNKIHTHERFGKYKKIAEGVNKQGRRWVRRLYVSGKFKGQIGYDYHGKDDSYYYQHPDGSQYVNDGKGGAKWRAPGKEAWKDCSKKQESGAVVKKEPKGRKESRQKGKGSGVVIKEEKEDGVVVKKEEAD